MKPLGEDAIVFDLGFDDLVELTGIEIGDAGDPGIRRFRGDDVVLFRCGQNVVSAVGRNHVDSRVL